MSDVTLTEAEVDALYPRWKQKVSYTHLLAGVEMIVAARVSEAQATIIHPNRHDDRDVRPWQPSDGDTRCQQCGIPNIVWYTDHDLWNRVMGDEGGVLCIGCFIHRAEAYVGIGTVWALLHQSSDINDDFRRGVSAGMAIRSKADHAEAQAKALEDAADAFQINTWADVVLPAMKTTGLKPLAVTQAFIDWLRTRAAGLRPGEGNGQ